LPIYEYACRDCEHQFETIQKISEDPLTDCPKCGKSQLKKLMSRAAFRLKGAGWYETDFKSSDKRNIAGDSKSSDTSESGGKSESSGNEKSDSSSTTEGQSKPKPSKESSTSSTTSSSPQTKNDK